MKAFHDISACPPAKLPKDPTDVKAILEVPVEAERCAVLVQPASRLGYFRARGFFACSLVLSSTDDETEMGLMPWYNRYRARHRRVPD
jgi:hypothetical protein